MSKLNQIKVGDKLEVTCSELSYEGLGVTRLENGYSIFTSNLFINEKAIVQVVKATSKFAFAKVINLITKSLDRNDIQQDCYNSAPLINLKYDKQIEFKNNYLAKLLSWNLGQDILNYYQHFKCSPLHENYRNKVRYPLYIKEEHLVLGEYDIKTNNLHLANNYSQNKQCINNALDYILKAINSFIITSKKQKNFKMFEEIIIRANDDEKLSVALKINSDYDLPTKLVNNLKENTNIIDLNVIKKDKIINLYKVDNFYMKLNDLSFNCNINSFFQINSSVAGLVFNKIKDLVSQLDSKYVLDAYCGVGVIGQLTSGDKEILGSDIVPSAISDADKNAKMNGIKAKYFVGDSATVFKKQVKDLSNTILILDPPRAGISLDFITWIKENKIKNVVYMSCDPKTLVRDLKLLLTDYEVTYIQGFDMFPNTAHIETLVSLKLK
ncbi:23S rRNA (uracil(1939)-C(5))-methyltransferase RlmD [Mycoplasma sp. Z244C]